MSGYSLWLAEGLWAAWGLYWFIAAWFTKRDAQKEPMGKRAGHIVSQALAFGLSFGFVPGTQLFVLPEAVQWAGVALTAVSLAFGIWARVHLGAYWSGRITIKEGHQVIRSGPYGFVRHPIYAAIIFGQLGAALASGFALHLLGPLVMSAAYVVKIRREEATLVSQLPGYADYRGSVKAIVPFVL